MFRSRLSLLVIAASLLMVRAGAAQTISSSVTFDGSIPPFGYSQSAGLLIVDGSGAPVLTLTNSATTSGIQDIYIGSTSGNTGGIAAYGGSSLVTNGVAILGFNAGSTGSITIAGTSGSGTASQWTGASQLYLGYNGAGYLTITGGGQVTSASTILGEFTNSTGVVTVAGTSVGGTASAWNLGANNLLLGNAASSSGTLTVTGGGQVNAGAISIATNATSTGALTISGPGSTFTVASGFGHGLWVSGTSIGSGGTGSLTVNNGGSLVDGSVLKVWNHGTLTLDTGGTISTSNFTRQTGGVFNFNDGTLTVSGGTYQQPNGALTINGSTATASPLLALINGAGTTGITSINLGSTAGRQGSIQVLSGATLSSSGNALLGSTTTSTASALISGSGSTWTQSGNFYVAGNTTTARGTASLTVNNGGALAVGGALTLYTHGTLTLDTGGSVTANSFSNSGILNFNGGTLTVSGGAYTQSSGTLALNGTNNPTLVLAGGATTSGITNVVVGNAAAATLNVLGGSVFSNSGSASLGLVGRGSGVATVSGSGSLWNVANNLYVGGSSSGAGGVGLLSVSGGGAVNIAGDATVYGGSTLSVGIGGTFTASSLVAPGEISNNGNIHSNVTMQAGGTLAGTGTIAGNLTQSTGSFYAPGNSPGIQHVYGDVTWNTMSYAMQIANISASPGIGYDSLAIHAANAALGQLTIVPGSTIEVDVDSYPTGTASLNFNNLSPFDLVLVSTEGGINGFNTGSFVINSTAFAANNPLGGGLFSIVESADLKNLLLHFAPAAVPEPATLALVGMAAAGLRWRLRRRR